jgi:biofilm PGA synthesis protein PgaD
MAESERKLHINVPALLPRRRRVADAVLTALMWAFYSYLWAPLISLVAWLLGFEFAYDVLVRAGGLQLLQDVIVFYGVSVALIFIAVSGWSIINRSRFAHHNRRKAIRAVTEEEISDYFGITAEQLATMRNSQIINVGLGDIGDIQTVESLLIRIDGESVRVAPPESAIAENEPRQDDEEPDTMVQRPS